MAGLFFPTLAYRAGSANWRRAQPVLRRARRLFSLPPAYTGTLRRQTAGAPVSRWAGAPVSFSHEDYEDQFHGRGNYAAGTRRATHFSEMDGGSSVVHFALSRGDRNLAVVARLIGPLPSHADIQQGGQRVPECLMVKQGFEPEKLLVSESIGDRFERGVAALRLFQRWSDGGNVVVYRLRFALSGGKPQALRSPRLHEPCRGKRKGKLLFARFPYSDMHPAWVSVEWAEIGQQRGPLPLGASVCGDCLPDCPSCGNGRAYGGNGQGNCFEAQLHELTIAMVACGFYQIVHTVRFLAHRVSPTAACFEGFVRGRLSVPVCFSRLRSPGRISRFGLSNRRMVMWLGRDFLSASGAIRRAISLVLFLPLQPCGPAGPRRGWFLLPSARRGAFPLSRVTRVLPDTLLWSPRSLYPP